MLEMLLAWDSGFAAKQVIGSSPALPVMQQQGQQLAVAVRTVHHCNSRSRTTAAAQMFCNVDNLSIARLYKFAFLSRCIYTCTPCLLLSTVDNESGCGGI
jgi:uncharacterized protein YcsI (UPF0317 family)